ncbi:MAG: TIGR04219 family outer membrane beta-barrel protein [Nitrospirae bacterium]|nr:TIGR04219 family outer membrane beta-barrel protein [Nitrospirota bacterium]
MKIFNVVIVLVLLSLALTPLPAYALGLEAAIGIWHQNPQGSMAYKETPLSIKDDLKYDSSTKFFGRAKIDMPLLIPNIYLMATPMAFDGSGGKNQDFKFGSRTYTANASFTSELLLDHYDIALYYGLPFINLATADKLNIDAGLNMRVIDLKVEVTQGSVSESKSLAIPVPMVYLGAQLKPVDKLSLEAELRAIAYSTNHYYDLIGRVKYRFFGPAFFGAGYRYEAIKINQQDLNVDLRFMGPFAEAGIEF